MGSFPDTFEATLLDLLYRDCPAGWSRPITNLYFALTTTAPTDAAAGTEVSYTGYARVGVAPSNANFSRTGSTVTNVADLKFALVAGGPTAAILGWDLYDAATGGNRLAWGTFPAGQQKVHENYDRPVIEAGQLSVTLD